MNFEKKIIRCPIHTNIEINEEVISDLIETPEFQRLKNIGQMTTINFLYPSATHTRFSHSLGVYENIRKIVTKYLTSASEDEILAVQCAGLLHDIGHGPLSHTFEHLCAFEHEQMTIKLINNKKGDIYPLLESYKKGFADKVAQFITKKSKSFLQPLVSGQLDADRMDYLLRDSHFTGTKYGIFDLDWLMHSMISFDNKLAFKDKSIPAIENYLFARDFMYRQVYNNPKVISHDILIKKIIERVVDLYNSKKIENIDNLFFKCVTKQISISPEIFINLDDHSFFEFMKNIENTKDTNLQFLLRLYKTKSHFNSHDSWTNQSDIDLNKFLTNNKLDKKYFFEKYDINNNVYKINKDPIYIVKNDKLFTLDKLSHIFNSLSDNTKVIYFSIT